MQRALSILALVLMVAGIWGLYFTRSLFSASPAVIVFQVLGFLLMIWARITFGRRSFHAAANPTTGGVVRTGPYRYLRHPIYTAVVLFTSPPAINSGVPLALAFAAVIAAGAVIRMLCEEYLLVQQYPDYRDYARTTKRMIPFVF